MGKWAKCPFCGKENPSRPSSFKLYRLQITFIIYRHKGPTELRDVTSLMIALTISIYSSSGMMSKTRLTPLSNGTQLTSCFRFFKWRFITCPIHNKTCFRRHYVFSPIVICPTDFSPTIPSPTYIERVCGSPLNYLKCKYHKLWKPTFI